jgi:hypothetical protein
MKITAILFSSILILCLLSTCYYDSQEFLFPSIKNKCDTNITFSLGVKPILSTNCFGCHSNATASFGGNVKLENYADVHVYAANGHLVGTIEHSPGFSAMPLNGNKIDTCSIKTIKKWIAAGILDN